MRGRWLPARPPPCTETPIECLLFVNAFPDLCYKNILHVTKLFDLKVKLFKVNILTAYLIINFKLAVGRYFAIVFFL